MTRHRRLTIPWLALAALAFAWPVKGAITTVDQQNVLVTGGGAAGIQGFEPLGQSFRPTLSSLNAVEFRIFDAEDNGLGATLEVRVRQGTIAGMIVGTSDPVALASNFAFGGVPVLFSFSAPVLLTPGQLYVLELYTVSGDNLVAIYQSPGAYSSGTLIEAGIPSSTVDLWFREGLATPEASVPEPATLGIWSFFALATGGCAVRGGRRRASQL